MTVFSHIMYAYISLIFLVVIIRWAYCFVHYYKNAFGGKPADNKGWWVRERGLREKAKDRYYDFQEWLMENKNRV